jgi:hypothetical protein
MLVGNKLHYFTKVATKKWMTDVVIHLGNTQHSTLILCSWYYTRQTRINKWLSLYSLSASCERGHPALTIPPNKSKALHSGPDLLSSPQHQTHTTHTEKYTPGQSRWQQLQLQSVPCDQVRILLRHVRLGVAVLHWLQTWAACSEEWCVALIYWAMNTSSC